MQLKEYSSYQLKIKLTEQHAFEHVKFTTLSGWNKMTSLILFFCKGIMQLVFFSHETTVREEGRVKLTVEEDP